MKESFACGEDSSPTSVLPSMKFPKVFSHSAIANRIHDVGPKPERANAHTGKRAADSGG